MKPTYCVIFKTHYWDAFIERQVERIRSQTHSASIVVVVDDTFGPVVVAENQKVVRVTAAKLAALDLVPVTTHGSILWYNIDYPHYIAMAELEPFDYYVTLEYDVVCNIDIDRLIEDVDAMRIDYVGNPIAGKFTAWPWFEAHRPVYGDSMLVYLSCFAIFSRRALETLLERRQQMGRDLRSQTLGFWPNNEAFIPTEIRNNGLAMAPLSIFGSVPRYSWWPPTHEDDIVASQSFIHPVLTGDRYVRSMLHHETSVANFFRPRSDLRCALRRYARDRQFELLTATFVRRLYAAIKRRLTYWSAPWYSNAAGNAPPIAQTKSAHN